MMRHQQEKPSEKSTLVQIHNIYFASSFALISECSSDLEIGFHHMLFCKTLIQKREH